MKVWVDVFSGDEMVSDSYKHKHVMNDAVLEVKAKYTTKGSTFVQIAADDEGPGDEEGETVINVVDAHELNEMTLTKKDFMAMIKAYLKRVVAHLKENGKEERVPGFQKGATELIKFVVEKFDEVQIFTGKSMDTEASLCFCLTLDGETDPTFYFLVDGCKEQKF